VASELVKKPAKEKGIYSVTSQLFLNFYKRRNPHNKKLVLQPVTEEFVFKEFTIFYKSSWNFIYTSAFIGIKRT
jgi:hypothetical protein